MLYARRLGKLGFLRRSTADLTNPNSIISLYRSVVLPTLLYGCQIWSPFLISLKSELEKVQHKFLRYIALKLHIHMS